MQKCSNEFLDEICGREVAVLFFGGGLRSLVADSFSLRDRPDWLPFAKF